MSKALDIRKEAKARIVTAGFGNTVVRGLRDFNTGELPGVCVYMTDTTKRAESGAHYASNALLVIEYHKPLLFLTGDPDADTDAADDLADAMIEQIRAAMEVEPRRFGDTRETALILSPGLSYESDEIAYPDDGAGSIAVRVYYSAPFVTNHG